MLIFIAWILLAINIYALILTPGYGRRTRPQDPAVGAVIAYSFGSGMLVFAALALSLATYLHSKNAYARTTWAAGIITLVLVFCLFFTVVPYSPRAEAKTAETTDATTTNATSDPPPDATSDTPDGLVTGILLSHDRPAAIIGTQLFYEGDVTCGIRIVKIHKDKVEFEKNDQTWTQAIQQPPPNHWK